MPKITTSRRTEKPLLPITIISHGTLTCLDLQEARRFYEEVLGFTVIQVSPVSMLARLGTDHVYTVVESGELSTMTVLGHNGLDVATAEQVDEAHRLLKEVKEEYGIRRINPILEQHGTYSFYFQDRDGNWWEIGTAKAPRGYTFAFEDPVRDLTGRNDVDPDLMEHSFDDEYAERLRGEAS